VDTLTTPATPPLPVVVTASSEWYTWLHGNLLLTVVFSSRRNKEQAEEAVYFRKQVSPS
jgi:hypothetical protein